MAKYTGNSFADYLLGYTNSSTLNDPLVQFGEEQVAVAWTLRKDTWKARPNLTFDLGVRYDRYLANACYKDLCSIWNPTDDKVVVAVGAGGSRTFHVSDLSRAGGADGWFVGDLDGGSLSQRPLYAERELAAAPRCDYRPSNSSSLVLRAGYGSYFNIFTGNRGASIINIPTWTFTVKLLCGDPAELEDCLGRRSKPGKQLCSVLTLVNIKRQRRANSNVTAEMPLYSSTTLTLSYVGTRVPNEISGQERNIATVGFHENLQADLPFRSSPPSTPMGTRKILVQRPAGVP